MDEIQTPSKKAKKRLKKQCQRMEDLTRKFARQRKLSEAEWKTLEYLIGRGGLTRMLLGSDLRATRKSARIWERMLVDHAEQNAHRNPRYYFGTFTCDEGNMSDRQPVVRLKYLQRKVDKVLRKLKLHGVQFAELQGLVNYPAGSDGRYVMLAIHVIIWTYQHFEPDKEAGKLNTSGAWKNKLGAPPVDFRPVSDAKGGLRGLAYYLNKPPHDGKNRVPHGNRFRLVPTTKGYRPEFAVRIIEGLSQFERRDLVRAVGEGKALRSKWCSRLYRWHGSRHHATDKSGLPEGVKELWKSMRKLKRYKKYRKYQITEGHDF